MEPVSFSLQNDGVNGVILKSYLREPEFVRSNIMLVFYTLAVGDIALIRCFGVAPRYGIKLERLGTPGVLLPKIVLE